MQTDFANAAQLLPGSRTLSLTNSTPTLVLDVGRVLASDLMSLYNLPPATSSGGPPQPELVRLARVVAMYLPADAADVEDQVSGSSLLATEFWIQATAAQRSRSPSARGAPRIGKVPAESRSFFVLAVVVGREILALLQRAWKEFGGGAGICIEEQSAERADVDGCSNRNQRKQETKGFRSFENAVSCGAR